MKQIYLCAIINISSGGCLEDCKFCTQSNSNKTNIQRYYKKSDKDILKEARFAKQNKAHGLCLVTSGAGLDDKKLEFVIHCANLIQKEIDINLIACNGLATKEQLKELKKAGIKFYNHNLESSQSYYPKI
jgi:biotin synthase